MPDDSRSFQTEKCYATFLTETIYLLLWVLAGVDYIDFAAVAFPIKDTCVLHVYLWGWVYIETQGLLTVYGDEVQVNSTYIYTHTHVIVHDRYMHVDLFTVADTW